MCPQGPSLYRVIEIVGQKEGEVGESWGREGGRPQRRGGTALEKPWGELPQVPPVCDSVPSGFYRDGGQEGGRDLGGHQRGHVRCARDLGPPLLRHRMLSIRANEVRWWQVQNL